jgi:CRISPR type I-D-associated protein Csc2
MANFRPSLNNLLPTTRVLQVAYTLTLLDDATIRSNAADEVQERTLKGEDHGRFLLPVMKLKHQIRKRFEGTQRLLMEENPKAWKEVFDEKARTCCTHNHCKKCVSCFLYGALGSVGDADRRTDYSLSSQERGTWALSFDYADQISDTTFNAIDPRTNKPGSAFGKLSQVPAGTVFYGEASLIDPTEDMAALFLRALEDVDYIGAGNTKSGRCEVKVVAVKLNRRLDPAWVPAKLLPRATAIGVEAALAELAETSDPEIMALLKENDKKLDERYLRLQGEVNKLIKVVCDNETKLQGLVKDLGPVFRRLDSEQINASQAIKELDGKKKAIKELENGVEILTLLADAKACDGPAKKGDDRTDEERSTALTEAIDAIREKIFGGVAVDIEAEAPATAGV